MRRGTWRCIGFLAAALTLCGLTARADYFYVKIDMSKVYQNVPAGVGIGGPPGLPGGGFPGGGIGLVPKTGLGKTDDGPFVGAIVELRSTPTFETPKKDDEVKRGGYKFDHPWGKDARFIVTPTLTPDVIKYVKIVHARPIRDFERLFKKDIATKDPAKLLTAATWALRNGLLTEFKSTMDELSKAAPKTPAAVNYQRVVNALKKPPTGDDPALKGMIADLTNVGKYHWVSGDSAFYGALTNLPPQTDVAIKRRVNRLQETLENFYFWFALQDKLQQPDLPKHRQLLVVPNSVEEFNLRHSQWGSQLFAGDGLTTRRDNFILMAYRPIGDAFKTLDHGNQDLWKKLNFKKDALISGTVWDNVGTRDVFQIAFAQTLTIVEKAIEEDSEISTLSREGTRQLLFASGILPRQVHTPEWIAQGLASYFETPPGAIHRGVGLPSWTNLISFNYFRISKKFDRPADVLTNVYTDRYYHVAQKDFSDLMDSVTSKDKINDRLFEHLDKANCTAWAFTYFLIERRRQPQLLLNYCRELNSLPRDLDLDERALEACFAKAFNVADAGNPTKIDEKKLATLADDWFSEMAGVSLESPEMQNEYLEVRRRLGKKIAGN